MGTLNPNLLSKHTTLVLNESAKIMTAVGKRALMPEIVLLGTGDRQRFPRPKLTRALLARGVGVEVMDTSAACRTYNIIMMEDRRVAAALLMMAD